MSNEQLRDEHDTGSERVSPVLVTGATGGLGLEVARQLAAYGDSLILAVRDTERGRIVAESIRQQYPTAKIEVGELNLASLASVAGFVERLTSDGTQPMTIICNAGIQIVDGVQLSEDGFELTMATNVLGHVALLAQLIPHLRSGARIVTLGSETHRGGLAAFGFPAAEWTDTATLLNPSPNSSKKSRAGRVRYSNSKLACIALAYELDRLLSERGIRAVAFDPGLMPATGLARGYPEAVKKLYAALVPLLIRLPGANSVAQSGRDLAWLVHQGESEGLMGKYVSGRRARMSSKASYTPGLGKDVWSTCCQAAGLEPHAAW